MLIGYARVSKGDQDTTLQLKALEGAGVQKTYTENASGGRWDRPELHKALEQLREGDVLVVWKLDRLSRSLKDLLTLLEQIEGQGAGFRSLTENIDTTTPAGRMMMQMVGSFAEFERAMIRERTRAGLEQARSQGRVGGRRPKLNAAQQAEIRDAVQSGRKTAADCARLFGVSQATVSRIVRGVALPAENANPFTRVIGTIPPLPGGAIAFQRELRGDGQEEVAPEGAAKLPVLSDFPASDSH
ncbi:recombinase family protein (plasmid) [Deinococcus wulumuqiensis]|uniref:Recombinase family protein n=1 Tax=Deinococcus wulumuqiensis TaxID=980427 RepID=A0A345ILH6_9DEIO|nr:recombinase family protein [Deinococcus wulumuqiensis]